MELGDRRSSAPEGFLEDVRRRVKDKLRGLPVTEQEIDEMVTGEGGMPLSYLKTLIDGDLKCEQCGSCCQVVTPISITPREKKTIAKHLNMMPSKLRRKYDITRDKREGAQKKKLWSLRGAPCPFLHEENICSIYPVRMHVCRAFPFRRMYEQGSEERDVELHPSCFMVREAMARFYASRLVARKFR